MESIKIKWKQFGESLVKEKKTNERTYVIYKLKFFIQILWPIDIFDRAIMHN